MDIETRWILNTAANGLHTALALICGAPIADRALGEQLAPEAAALADDLAAQGLAVEDFGRHAVPLAVRFDTPARWAEVLGTKLKGREPAGELVWGSLGRRLISLEAALRRARPELLDELELRSAPLREQWEARCRGLAAELARLTAAEMVVSQADVVLVLPILGGGGAAYPAYNVVALEALLANADDRLPEVVRLAWLVAQLNLDLPKFQDHLPPQGGARVGRLALLPAVLAAAQHVELARLDPGSLALAIDAWRAGPADPDQLFNWWETYQTGDASWPVALGALARILG